MTAVASLLTMNCMRQCIEQIDLYYLVLSCMHIKTRLENVAGSQFWFMFQYKITVSFKFPVGIKHTQVGVLIQFKYYVNFIFTPVQSICRCCCCCCCFLHERILFVNDCFRFNLMLGLGKGKGKLYTSE